MPPYAPSREPELDPRPLSAVEEVTLLASALETLTAWNLRSWHLVTGNTTKPEKTPGFQKAMQDVADKNPHLSDTGEIKEAAARGIQGRRRRLLWALATVIFVRDSLHHGKGIVHTLEPYGPLEHMKTRQGLVVLPPGSVIDYRHLPNAPTFDEDEHLQDFLRRVCEAFRAIGQEITTEELHDELQEICENAWGLTVAFQTVRMALIAGFLAGQGEDGEAFWDLIADTLCGGYADLAQLE